MFPRKKLQKILTHPRLEDVISVYSHFMLHTSLALAQRTHLVMRHFSKLEFFFCLEIKRKRNGVQTHQDLRQGKRRLSRAIRFSFGSCDGRSQALGHMTVVVIDLNQDIEYRPSA